MLLQLLSFLTGLAGPLATIAGKITDLEQAKVAAQTDKEKAEIDASVEQLHDRRAVLIAEVGNRTAVVLNASMAFLMALGGMLYINKILIWDKVIGSFALGHPWSTDSLDSNLWWVVMAGFGYYLLVRIVK